MKTVKWSFGTGHDFFLDNPRAMIDVLDPDFVPFSNLSKEIIFTRKNVIFLKCPAHTDFLKNTYIFKSPIDINFEIDVVEQGESRVFCENISQEIFDHIVDLRFLTDNERGITPYPVIGIDFLNTLRCNESLSMQVFPAFMHYNDFTSKATIIPGEFDISKWTRPVELVFEVKNKKEKFSIKKGDALSYFKFNSDDHIKLEKEKIPWEDIKICNDLRSSNLFRPLKERYEAFKKFKDEQKNR